MPRCVIEGPVPLSRIVLLDNKKTEYPEISEPLSRRRQVSFLSRSAGSNVVAKEPFIEEFTTGR